MSDLVVLYQKMADLTRPKCGECRVPLSCCDSMYCDLATDEAKRQGVELKETGHPELKYMGPTGCVVPPHIRKLCTLHLCSINSLGFQPEDPRFTKQYFKLREEIERGEIAAHRERRSRAKA